MMASGWSAFSTRAHVELDFQEYLTFLCVSASDLMAVALVKSNLRMSAYNVACCYLRVRTAFA